MKPIFATVACVIRNCAFASLRSFFASGRRVSLVVCRGRDSVGGCWMLASY